MTSRAASVTRRSSSSSVCGGGQRERGVGELAQLLAAAALERGERAGLGVQPGPLDDLGGLPGVELDELEVAGVRHDPAAVVGRQRAHRLAGEREHRHAKHRAHAVLAARRSRKAP